MRHLWCVALLGVLLLPAGRAFAAANPSLEIDISVSIDSAVTIQWADATTAARTWTIGAVNLNVDRDTLALATDATKFDVKNVSQVPVAITIGVTSQGLWKHKKKTGGDFAGLVDQFWIQASLNNTDFTAPVELATYVAGVETVPLVSPLAKDATQTVDLQFHTPVTVSTGAPGTIKVVMTATAL